MHEPSLEPRDEVVFLLTAAAEIEHALMVQYLYAAYSLRVVDGDPNFSSLREIQNIILQIAREEMGHLMTVQNLLHVVGGPLNFNREHSPYASDVYPFRFKLEPMTLDSLAKYVVAESPGTLPDDFPVDDRVIYERLVQDARRSNDGNDVRHVGPIFARLEELLSNSPGGVEDEDFRLDTLPLQGRFDDWGFEPKRKTEGERLIIEAIDRATAGEVRAAAAHAIRAIGQQGEASDVPPASSSQSESHFERFFDVYKRVESLMAGGASPLTWPVAENPNTSAAPAVSPSPMKMVEVTLEARAAKGRITDQRARDWAHLFNLRYRALLGYLSHFLRLDESLYVEDGAGKGDRTSRGLLLIWAFGEMRRLKKIANVLVRLPKDDLPTGVTAGPPFELPYTLNLPEREADRWRSHLDVSRASVRLVRERLRRAGAPDAADGFLEDLVASDEKDQAVLASLAAGGGVPAGTFPEKFKKVALILEEAVRGFDIGVHGAFWGGISHDTFVAGNFSPQVPETVHQNSDGTFDVENSPLVQRIESTVTSVRMPRMRPAIPESRTRFVREWIAGGCPDNDPTGQIGIMRERNPDVESLPVATAPTPSGELSFASDIKGLFREDPDRQMMLIISQFDLHKFEDVRDRADAVLAVLLDGSMPCDGSWPADRIATFRRWIDQGKRP